MKPEAADLNLFDLVFQEVDVEDTKLLQACLPFSYASCWALKLDAEAQYPQICMSNSHTC